MPKDRKSTRLNSSHSSISYAVFCLKKKMLEVLAERLTRALPKDTTVGRLAGDEFALFVDGLPSESDNRGPVAHLARSILAEVSKAFQLNQHEVFLTASIGIAFCPLFFFNDTAPTEIYTLSLHDALPI